MRYIGTRLRWVTFICAIALASSAAMTTTAASGPTIESDDFHSSTLNTTLWTTVDPTGDATFHATGTNVWIHVPGRAAHTLWSDCACAPQLLQAAPNTDFEIEAKFDSAPSRQYQLQGLVVHEDADTYLRFDVNHDGTNANIYAAYLNGVNPPVTKINATLPGIPAYLRLTRAGDTWTFKYSYDGSSWTSAGSFSRTMTVSEAGVFAGNEHGAPFLTPPFTASVDYFFNTAAPISPEDGGESSTAGPLTVVWNGDVQAFGQRGVPQDWVNIVGTVWGPDGIASLSYTLNGGSSNPLTVGPDGARLSGEGDYNIEIAYDDLLPGANAVVITSADTLGQFRDTTVTIDFTDGMVWSKTDTLDWGAAAEISDEAHIVDGKWSITPSGLSVDPLYTGFQRTVVIGDRTWSPDYEVTLPFTVDSADIGGSTRVGMIIGWEGHSGAGQPRQAGSYQTLVWVNSFTSGPTLRLVRNGGQVAVSTPVTTSLGERYLLKVNSQTVGNGVTHVKARFWKDGDPEPGTWAVEEDFVTRAGSILLVADYGVVTVGDAVVAPVATLGHALATSTTGGGVIQRSPDYTLYADSAVVQLTAAPDSGWAFLGWGDGLSGRVNPSTVTMASDTTVSATFVPAIVSDDFHAPSLNTALWRILDPTGGADVGMSGTNLLFRVEGGASHDLWSDCNCAPRILQPAADTDFEIEVKFDGRGRETNQGQGVIVQQDDDTYLRFDVVYNSSSYSLFAGYVDGGSATTKSSSTPIVHPTYFRVKRTGDQWLLRYSDDGVSWKNDGSFTQALTVTEIGLTAINDNAVPSQTPTFISNVDYFFNIAYPITPEDGGELTAQTPPLVDVWYGDDQDFGSLGIAQRWVNVLGRVLDTEPIASLSYTLNGGAPNALTMGPNNQRLGGVGDFIVEIDFDSLVAGPNDVAITAVDTLGETTEHHVTITHSDGITWEMPYATDWASAASADEQAHVVAGRWDASASGIRTANGATGYDRCVAVGDYRWPSEYEAIVPLTIHAGNVGGTSAIGFVIGWRGHSGVTQPREGTPFQTAAWIRDIPANPRIELRDDEVVHVQSAMALAEGVPYYLKMRSEQTGPGLVQVSMKVWPVSGSEPAAWDLTDGFAARDGSALLVAHYADVTFGDVSITPLETFPQHVLDVQVSGSGSVLRVPDYATYTDSAQVVLTAVPDSGWVFDGWSGGLSSTENPDTIVMLSDTSVTATFSPIPTAQYTIDVTVVGGGMVVKDPNQATYDAGATVALVALPDSGWVFVGWSGDLNGSAVLDSVTVNDSLSITATFGQAVYTVTTGTVGSGTVTRSPNRASYAPGEKVVLTAAASSGWTFIAWTEGLSGSLSPDTITVMGDTTITATFNEQICTVAVTIIGTGSVSIKPNRALYAVGEKIVLTAFGSGGMGFSGWSGDVSGTTNPDTVVIDSSMAITATFSPVTAAGNTPSLAKLTLLNNSPNPFTQSTSFTYGLPSAADVEIEVYDAAGRLVYSERIPSADAGWHNVRFEGVQRNGQRLPSGVYFYRVRALQSAVTRKMVLIR